MHTSHWSMPPARGLAHARCTRHTASGLRRAIARSRSSPICSVGGRSLLQAMRRL
jgi:hypothetical protein